MKVWLVGQNDCESTWIRHVCLSHETALKRWEEIRLELIEEAKRMWLKYDDEMYERIVTNLSATQDPEKMNNYPQDEPYICEMETED